MEKVPSKAQLCYFNFWAETELENAMSWAEKSSVLSKHASKVSVLIVQLRDPKNDFIFNFNFVDKMKNLWTVWISCKINQHYSTPEKMSWANAHLNLCKLLETELRLAQRLAQLTLTTVSLWLEFLNFGQSKWKMIQHVNNLYFGLKN